MLNKFDELYSKIILEMIDTSAARLIKKIEVEGLNINELKEKPDDQYKYPCILRKEGNDYEPLFQFILPAEVEAIEDIDTKIDIINDIADKISKGEQENEGGEMVVMFLNRLERRAFTVIESDVKDYYAEGQEPWKI